MLQKKRGVLNFITLAYFSSKKMIDIHFYCQGYENSKGLAIIHDFTAHCLHMILTMNPIFKQSPFAYFFIAQ